MPGFYNIYTDKGNSSDKDLDEYQKLDQNYGIMERKRSSGFRRIFTVAFDRLCKC